ncbi:MAG: hypothetical protein HY390_05845 [Deltaproteobacteria bacterium]|nr:hypothetical protein [Deltaproteobacteria bacterium]
MMTKIRFVVSFGIMIGGISISAWTQTLSNYQDQIERIFLTEAGSAHHFKSAIQTARLLGLLEYMQPQDFSRFYGCISKEKGWEYLSAKKRQDQLNACKAQGRNLSGQGSFTPLTSLSVTPAQDEKQEKEIKALRKEILELRNIVEKMSTQLKDNDDHTLELLNRVSRVPSAVIPSNSQETTSETFEVR